MLKSYGLLYYCNFLEFDNNKNLVRHTRNFFEGWGQSCATEFEYWEIGRSSLRPCESLAWHHQNAGYLSDLAEHNDETAKFLSELRAQNAAKVFGEGKYQQYLNGSGADALSSLCQSADSGNAKARKELGRLYEWGLKGLPEDRAISLFWYRMSGYLSESEVEFSDEKFPADEIAAVNQLMNDWQPGDCEAMFKAQLEADKN